MDLSALESDRPAWPVRIMLVAEVIVLVGTLSWYLWTQLPAPKTMPWHTPVVIGFALLFPIGMNLLHGDRPRDSGIRADTLAGSSVEVAVATAVMGGGLLLVGLWTGSVGMQGRTWDEVAARSLRYVAWGLLQQYWLQAFALRRLRQAQLPTPAAILVATAIFGWLHAPNWPLVALTTGAGVVWCWLFLRRPNLLTLGLAHAVLGMLAYHCLPEEWVRRMSVGGNYLREIAKAAGS